MSKLFEFIVTVLIEIATWQDNAHYAKRADPITSRWIEIQRKVVAFTLLAILLLVTATATWLALPTSNNFVAVLIQPILVLFIKGAIVGSFVFTVCSAWYFAQIIFFERWPHDFD